MVFWVEVAQNRLHEVARHARAHDPLFEAMAHPFRVAIRNVLRKENGLTIAELRRCVSANYEEIDTRNIQFHLFRMQMNGVVSVAKAEKKEIVTLVRDISLLSKEA